MTRAPQGDSQILFVHRRLSDGDVCHLNNRKARTERIEARFRVVGKKPELWRADTGATEPVSYRIENGHTVIPLELSSEDSYFIVFRTPASASAARVVPVEWETVAQLNDNWDVYFQSDRGAPTSTHLTELQPLNVHADPGIKYFSGVATYRKTFGLPRGMPRNAPLMLDLGMVGDVAEVRLNGRHVGTVWKAPYRIDISGAVRPHDNELDIRVANLWVNRLVGDAQESATKVTFTTVRTYRPDAPLRPSGLMGPVTLLGR